MCDCDLGKWICDVTGAEDLDKAKAQVSRAVEIMSMLPMIGALTLIISPAGVLDTTVSQKLVSDVSGLETIEMALLEVQQGIIHTRRQMNSVPPTAPTPVEPEVPVPQATSKTRRRSKKEKAVSATPDEINDNS